MDKPLVYIKHSSSHHSLHSGYARLLDYVDGDFLPGSHSFIPYQFRKVIASFSSGKAGIYNTNSVQKELCLAVYLLSKKNGIAHFLNGERDIRYSTYLKAIRNWKFVATFHKPPDTLKKLITDYRYLKRLDGAIAVGINQVDFLKKELGIDNVAFIPHGVDTEFFKPISQELVWEQYSGLFVGEHLRDFETLGACVTEIKKHVPDFKMRAVLGKDAVKLLPKSLDIEVYSGISDEHLRTLYRKSSLLLLPLEDSTACNSIVEALACGLPIITNTVGGVAGYLDENCGYLLSKKNYKGMAEAAIYLMENKEINRNMRKNCRIKGEDFAWENISKSILQTYEKWFGKI